MRAKRSNLPAAEGGSQKRDLARTAVLPTSGAVDRRQHMLIRKRRGWELPDSTATSEAAFRDRRRLLQGLAAGPILMAAGLGNFAAGGGGGGPPAGVPPGQPSGRDEVDPPLERRRNTTPLHKLLH